MSYVVIKEMLGDPPARYTTKHPTRAAAMEAMGQSLADLRARGAIITGDPELGYTVAWREAGHELSLRITLGQVQ